MSEAPNPAASPSSSDLPNEQQHAAAPDAAPARINIDLDAVAANYRYLRDLAAPAECAAVVKADCYGLGAARISPVLWREGCRTFYVATLEEGIALRALLPEADFYAFDGLLPGTAPLFAETGIKPVLNSLAEIGEWARFCAQTGQRLKAGIHLDSGMNRLGLPAAEFEALLNDPDCLRAFTPTVVMSHLACSDTPEHPKNEIQRARFDALCKRLPGLRASLANSGGVMLGSAYHFDQVRPGIGIYGGQPVPGAAHRFETVVTLECRILQIREAPAGDSIGYGATRTLDKPARIATIAAGYADGVSWLLSAGDGVPPHKAFLAGHLAPVLGRISMDLVTLDVTDIPETIAKRGAFVELLGPNVELETVARHARTVNYEVLTNLHRRATRRYVGENA